MGGEITYTHIGGTTYKISLRIYRDCTGINLSNTEIINIKGPNSYSTQLVLSKVGAPEDAVELCPTAMASNMCNGGSAYNAQMQVYEGLITLPAVTGNYFFTYNSCCRNGSIVNLAFPSGSGIWLESWLDFTYGHHNSPDFYNHIPVLLKNNTQQYIACGNNNPTPYLPNHYTYRLVSAKNDNGYPLYYSFGHSPSQPFGGIATVLDSITGLLSVTPTNTSNYVVSIEASAPNWGGVLRDIQISVNTSSNQIPTLSGIDSTNNYDTTVYMGSPITFSVYSNDPDTLQSVTIHCSTLPGSSFTTSGGQFPSGTFTWTPQQPGKYFVNMRVQDNNCSNNGIRDYIYTIEVLPGFADAGPDVIICDTLPVQIGGSPTATGGVAPYTYLWSPSIGLSSTTDSNPFAHPGTNTTYTVVVTDAVGVTGSDEVTVVVSPSMSIGLTSTNPDCYGSNNGSVCSNISGGVAPFAYYWSNSASTTCISNLNIGVYSLTVVDYNGCSSSAHTSLSQPTQLMLQFNALPQNYLEAVVTGGVSPFSYAWSHGSNTNPTNASVCTNSNICVTVTDANGCTVSGCIAVNTNNVCVWPGDANYDGVVDNYDLLPIGIGYGTIGYPRANASILWVPQLANDWADTLIDGTNYKHADCNGNGQILADDTMAIIQNFGLTHPRNEWQDPRSNTPALLIEMMPDTVTNGGIVIARLILGDSNTIASNVYGLAFTLNFDPLVVDSNTYDITFSNNSWLCNNNSDNIDIRKKLFALGEIRAAVTRIDQTTRSGFGEIGTATFKITTGNINGKNTGYHTMHTYITDLIAVDQYGNLLQIDGGRDSLLVEYQITGLPTNDIHSAFIQLNPNPTNSMVNVICNQAQITKIELFNSLAQSVFRQTATNRNSIFLEIDHLPEGVYIVAVHSTAGTFYSRLLKR